MCFRKGWWSPTLPQPNANLGPGIQKNSQKIDSLRRKPSRKGYIDQLSHEKKNRVPYFPLNPGCLIRIQT